MGTILEHLKSLRAWRGGAPAGLVLIAALALSLRLASISATSLWTDEGYSLWFAGQSYGDLFGEIARTEFNPPLYYGLLRAWMAVFGDSVAALRSLSAVIDVAAIPFVYLTARWAAPEGYSRSAGLIAALLFALSSVQIDYSQELRAYCLLVPATAMMAAASMRILKDCGEAPVWAFVLLGLGGALAIWSHYTAAVALALIGAWHAWLWLGPARRAAGLLRGYLISGAAFLTAGGYALWLMLAYALPSSADFWIGPPNLADIADAATSIFGASLGLRSFGTEIVLRAALFLAWPLLGAYGLWRRGDFQSRAVLSFLLLISFGSFATYLGVTFAGKPVFLQRILIAEQVGWLVLCALAPLGLARFETAQKTALFALLAVFAVTGLGRAFSPDVALRKEPWREAAREIAARAGPGERVFTSASGELLMAYYLPRLGRDDLTVISLNGHMSTPAPDRADDPGGRFFTPAITPQAGLRLASGLADGAPAWWVVRKPDGNSWAPVRAVLEDHGAERAEDLEPGPIGIWRIHGRRAEQDIH